MEYHYVVVWSEENGWELDISETIRRYHNNNMYIPNMHEWISPATDSETARKELFITDELYDTLENLNKVRS